MRKLIYFAIGVFFLTGCIDIDYKIIGVDFHANEIYDNYSAETEFLSSELIFGADFLLDEGPVQGFVDETTLLNPVIEDKLVLTSNRDLLLTNDTIKSGENLLDFFEYKKLHRNWYSLSYNFRCTENFMNQTGYYKFYFTAHLSDNTEVSDSCLVKIYFSNENKSNN